MSAEKENESDDMNVPIVAYAGVVGSLVTFILIVALQAVFYKYDRSTEEYKSLHYAHLSPLWQQRLAQQAALEHVAHKDPASGRITIGIDQAMHRIVAEYGKKKDDETDS